MADMIVPFQDDDEELESVIAAELSKNDDLVDYIQVNSLDALKARFSEAEEDENIRNEGFQLARKGGLIRKPHPNEESVMPYMSQSISPKDDIATEKDSELSAIFESTKSEHDSDNVLFSELNIDTPPVQSEEENRSENAPEEQPAESGTEEEAPKKKRGRPRKNALPEELSHEEQDEEEKKQDKKPADVLKYDGEEYVLTPKFNTHTEIIYVDESLDDGIKRNSDEELEALFKNNGKGKISKLWQRRKK